MMTVDTATSQVIYQGPLPTNRHRLTNPIGLVGPYRLNRSRRVRALVWSDKPGEVALVTDRDATNPSKTTVAKPSTKENPWVLEADVWADDTVRVYFLPKDNKRAEGGFIVEQLEV